jgi:hypothetical protein
MLADVLIAIVIVAIAAVLGLVVHPLLWFIAVLAILVLVGRHHGGRRSGSYVGATGPRSGLRWTGPRPLLLCGIHVTALHRWYGCPGCAGSSRHRPGSSRHRQSRRGAG